MFSSGYKGSNFDGSHLSILTKARAKHGQDLSCKLCHHASILYFCCFHLSIIQDGDFQSNANSPMKDNTCISDCCLCLYHASLASLLKSSISILMTT